MDRLKLLSAILIILLVANITLFALGRLNVVQFWVILAIIGIFAYKGMPYLKKKLS
ncbi:hypothetical protein GF336_03100 [Candidatus Woesearchaeota archaeon]|nr:hypothetical protein [Candidatus Woesearchaeota archaeon]